MININSDTYEKDHMHPKTPFIDNIKTNFPNKTENERNKLIKMMNRLPNLQLLTKDENDAKSDIPLQEYIKKKKRKKLPFLPKCSYDVKNFELFYEARKKILKRNLCKKFKIDIK